MAANRSSDNKKKNAILIAIAAVALIAAVVVFVLTNRPVEQEAVEPEIQQMAPTSRGVAPGAETTYEIDESPDGN